MKWQQRWKFDLTFKGAAVGSLAGQLAERGVNHFIEDREVRSDLGSLADLAENPARELVKTAGVTALDGALGALGGKMDAGDALQSGASEPTEVSQPAVAVSGGSGAAQPASATGASPPARSSGVSS